MSTKKNTQITLSVPSSSVLSASAGSTSVQGLMKKKKKRAKKSNQSVVVTTVGSRGLRSTTASPTFRPLPNGRIRVSHRELVSDIQLDNLFNPRYFAVNPGLPSVFPWLSSLARNYEFYAFQKLAFEYEPLVSSTTSGAIYMAMDYDAFDYPATTKSDFMMAQGSTRCPCWDRSQVVAAPDNLKSFSGQRYTRQAGLAANLDIKTYDVAQLNVVAFTPVGTNAGLVCGELYVSYVVDLITPQPPVWDFWQAETVQVTDGSGSDTFPIDKTVVKGSLGIEVNNTRDLTFTRKGVYSLVTTILGSIIEGQVPSLIFSNVVGGVDVTPLLSSAVYQGNRTVLQHMLKPDRDGARMRLFVSQVPNYSAWFRFAPFSPLAL